MFRAARPIIWMSDQADRRKPSLSASRIATRVTSGRSIPSRRRLIPTRTSNTPSRRSRRIATRSSVSTSLWRYWTLTPSSLQVVGQVLGHLLGQGRDERPLAALDRASGSPRAGRRSGLGRADRDRRVDHAGRPDELLDDALAALELVRPGRRAHVDRLVDGRLELLERQRPVVERRRQAEPEVDEDLLARPVVLVHPDDLRDRHVRLVDDEQPVRREVVEQRPRPAARLAARQVARVVLDAGAVAELAHHLEVERRALAEPGALEGSTLGLETGDPLLHLGLDVDDRFLELVLRRDVVASPGRR